MTPQSVKTRNDFPKLLNAMGLKGRAAEVGVAEGYFSWHLLDHWPGVVYLIDPWRILDVYGYSGHGEATQKEQDARFERIRVKALTYKGGRAKVRRSTSAEAVGDFYDGFFDFIYLDANHSYKAVSEDIRWWWPKVKSGGVLAGHDYLDGVIESGDYGVKTAVTEFAKFKGLMVNSTEERDYPSWWIVKP